MSVEAAERYVAAGAALLDEKGPEGWRGTLYAERGRLDMAHANNCVLGILYDDFWNVVWDDGGSFPVGAEITPESAHTFGFNSGGFEDLDSVGYDELKDAWLDEIEPPEDPDQDRDLGLI